MKISYAIIVSALISAFVLGRKTSPNTAPIQKEPKTIEWYTNWYSSLPVVPEREYKDLRETALRAHYFNQMREQELRRRQQWIDAELEARRIQNEANRPQLYGMPKWDYCPNHGQVLYPHDCWR